MDHEESLEAVQRNPTAAVRQLLESRLRDAAGLRRALGLPCMHTDVFRLINGEGDGLSGLVIDMLGPRTVVAPSAAWCLHHKSALLGALSAILPGLSQDNSGSSPVADVHWRPATTMLEKEEGCPAELVGRAGPMDLVGGSVTIPAESLAPKGPSFAVSSPDAPAHRAQPLMVTELGLRYQFDPDGPSQKTGFYADQRDSRAFLRGISHGKRVLDLCCYTGGFSLNAAAGGAATVLGLDSSAAAVAAATAAAELNGLGGVAKFERGDIRTWMTNAAPQKNWDIVVLDPPKLARGRAGLHRARGQYLALNTAALRLVAPGGLLMTCSCSGAMTQSAGFVPLLQEAAAAAGRRIAVLRVAGAAADHPVAPEHPEGAYLTNVLIHVA